jgi:hypothetical protein
MRSLLRASLVIFLFVVAPARAQFGSVGGIVDCTTLTGACFIKGMKIKGEISSATADKVTALIAQLHKAAGDKSIHPFSVEFDSPGGSVNAAYAIGRTIRRENMGVTIRGAFAPASPGICNSACVLLFAAGVHRSFNEYTSKLGIHRPYLEVPTQEVSPDSVSNGYRQMLQGVRDYLREMNVSEQLADAMFRIDPEHVKFLSQRAATDFGLTEWDPVYKETMDLAEAKKLNLNRREYIARRILALRDCYWLRTSINDAINDWMDCYTGVMTNTRQAPSPPPPPAGTPDFSRYGTPAADPIDWSRYPVD